MVPDAGPRTTEATWKERYHRLAKALKIADVIEFSAFHAGFSTADLSTRDDVVWRDASIGAGFAADYDPSFETREVAIRMVREREETGRRLMAMKESITI
jgi:hypothetical protein